MRALSGPGAVGRRRRAATAFPRGTREAASRWARGKPTGVRAQEAAEQGGSLGSLRAPSLALRLARQLDCVGMRSGPRGCTSRAGQPSCDSPCLTRWQKPNPSQHPLRPSARFRQSQNRLGNSKNAQRTTRKSICTHKQVESQKHHQPTNLRATTARSFPAHSLAAFQPPSSGPTSTSSSSTLVLNVTSLSGSFCANRTSAS